MGHSWLWYILILKLLLFCTSCNYFNVKKIDRKEVKEMQLKEITNRGLQNYPKIDDCNSEQNSKECFENQLINHFHASFGSLKKISTVENFEKDTVWLVVHVTKDGEMSLKPHELEEEFEKVFSKIDSTLFALSPIQPAHINGVNVNCNFKLPLVINSDDN